VASKMTTEETKETRQKVTTKMDFLNQSLGDHALEFFVHCRSLPPAEWSTQWYRLHLSSRRIHVAMGREIESRQGICRVVALIKLRCSA
jgi:hypothetical protein